MKIILCTLFFISSAAFASQQNAGPVCKSMMLDLGNNVVAKLDWKDSFFTGIIDDGNLGVRITASLGGNQVMSLWIREKREPNPNGALVFVDMSSGREQKSSLYLANGYHVEVTCQWQTY